MSPVVCDKCNKTFRGNYQLNRHNLRKFPCVKEKIQDKIPKQKETKKPNQDSSGCNVTIINNNINQVVNNYFTINGDLSHIDIEKIIQ